MPKPFEQKLIEEMKLAFAQCAHTLQANASMGVPPNAVHCIPFDVSAAMERTHEHKLKATTAADSVLLTFGGISEQKDICWEVECGYVLKVFHLKEFALIGTWTFLSKHKKTDAVCMCVCVCMCVMSTHPPFTRPIPSNNTKLTHLRWCVCVCVGVRVCVGVCVK